MSTVICPVEMIRDEIDCFLEAARKRCEYDPVPRRRMERRYHRSWPLQVRMGGGEMTTALHNASRNGLAFLSARPIGPGTIIFIHLFCHDDERPRVPAVVRHATPNEHGYLIGCEFMLEDDRLCSEAVGRQGVWGS